MARARLADIPTIRLDVSELRRFAREADESILQGKVPDAEPSLEIAAPETLRPSEMRLTTKGEDDPIFARVPILVASRDDLTWFGLEEGAQALLALIDGQATVREILAIATVPAERALAFLHELEMHRVVAFE